jgi:hypothetical protein
VNGAGSTLTNAAAELRAYQVEIIAKNPKERGISGHVHWTGLAVYLKVEFRHGERG